MHARFIVIMATLLLFSGCVTEANQQKEADEILEQLHQAMQLQQWDRAAKLYSPKFFRQKTQRAWQHEMQELQESMGKMKAFKVTSRQKDPRYGGDFYIYIVSIEHERGFSRETVTIYRGLNDTKLAIFGYKLEPRRAQ